MTPTKTKRAAKPDDATTKAIDVIQQAAQQQRALQAGYFAVCRKAASGDKLTQDDHTIVAALEKTPDEFASDVGRVQAVARQKAVAGSAGDRARAQRALDSARKTRDDEAPVIHEQIADLQTTLAKLDRGVTESQADVLRREKAVEWLREPGHLPPAQQHIYHSQRRALNEHLRPPIDKLESRLKTIDAVTELQWETRMDPAHESAVNHCRAHAKSCVVESGRGPRIDFDAWLAYLAELKNERVRLMDDLTPLRDKCARELAKVEKTLDHWLEE